MKQITSVLSFANGIEVIADATFNLLIDAAVKAKEDMQTTTVHFETVAPDFTIDILTRTAVEIGPEDNYGGQIWAWLDLGTSVRYATMTPDWVSKTRPNTFHTRSSNPGRLAFVNTQRPRDGIAAREWTTFITKIRGAQLQNNFIKQMQRINVLSSVGAPKSADFRKYNTGRR